ncbi:MAG: DUF255 domain-containing protein [Hyphomicrobium sp.]
MRARLATTMPILGAILGAGFALVLAVFHAVTLGQAAERGDGNGWRPWSASTFETAKAEGKFVLLDLEAVWCHWCHVMEETTYRDPKVKALLAEKFVTVRVDQDANPDLSNRYGDWGWPATIIFAADGRELVKRRGYIAPDQMASLLAAVIADPTPGPSVSAVAPVVPADHGALSAKTTDALHAAVIATFDEKNAGWGTVHKYIDADSFSWAMTRAAEGDAMSASHARRTLDAALALIDPAWGGLYQYSDAADWSSPHYEKIMAFQANGIAHYALGYARWRDPKYLTAARQIAGYLTNHLMAPDGTFHTSQDADVDAAMPGRAFYALDAAARTVFGRQPRIDTNIYARENGWAISALAALYDVTGDATLLAIAERAATAIIAERRTSTGIYRHGARDRGGPYLGDTLAMGQAALDLYQSTGRRDWLAVAGAAADVIARDFVDTADGGIKTTLTAEAGVGVFLTAHKPIDEQVQVARFANRVYRYTGATAHRDVAEHAMKYLASPAILDLPRAAPGVLLASREIANDPAHMTIVGAKALPASQALHAAARAVAVPYKRIDWWDRSEGPMLNPDVTYPELDVPAAFICTNRICSLPIFEPAEIAETLARLTAHAVSSKGAAADSPTAIP